MPYELSTPDKLKLRPLADDDIPLIKSWLNREHVKKWYDMPPLFSVSDWVYEIEHRETEYSFITHFIAVLGERPIGFGQIYAARDAEEDWYGNTLLSGAYSLDYLIGEEEFLGRGLGRELVGLLVSEVFARPDAERIIVQPDSENAASCRALLAAGFHFDCKNCLYTISNDNR